MKNRIKISSFFLRLKNLNHKSRMENQALSGFARLLRWIKQEAIWILCEAKQVKTVLRLPICPDF